MRSFFVTYVIAHPLESLTSSWPRSLPEGDELALELGALEEAGLFSAYIERVEASLNVYTQKLDERPGDLFKRLWRQLAVTANVFGVRCAAARGRLRLEGGRRVGLASGTERSSSSRGLLV